MGRYGYVGVEFKDKIVWEFGYAVIDIKGKIALGRGYVEMEIEVKLLEDVGMYYVVWKSRQEVRLC